MNTYEKEAIEACNNPSVLSVASLYCGVKNENKDSSLTLEEFNERAERLISKGFKGLI